jgi:drug/metabolite transporter (DMT)-like permease
MNQIVNSIKKNKIGILIMIIDALFTAFGQFFWKISNGENFYLLILGFVCYGIGAIGMIVAFKYGSFSVLHPMVSVGYIFSLLIGYYFLSEVINGMKLIGVFLILSGVIMLGAGDE